MTAQSKQRAAKERKFFALVHPGAPRGVVHKKPKLRKQDKRAKPAELYAVVFFPKITGIGKAEINFYGVHESLASTPEAARVKFMDRLHHNEKWNTYAEAGHRIRKVKIVDLGDAS